MPFDAEKMRGYKATVDLIDADTGEVVLETGKKLTVRQARQMAEKGLKALRVDEADIHGRYVAEPVQFAQSGPVRIPAPVPDPLPGRLGLAALGTIAALIGWRTLREAGGHHG